MPMVSLEPWKNNKFLVVSQVFFNRGYLMVLGDNRRLILVASTQLNLYQMKYSTLVMGFNRLIISF